MKSIIEKYRKRKFQPKKFGYDPISVDEHIDKILDSFDSFLDEYQKLIDINDKYHQLILENQKNLETIKEITHEKDCYKRIIEASKTTSKNIKNNKNIKYG